MVYGRVLFCFIFILNIGDNSDFIIESLKLWPGPARKRCVFFIVQGWGDPQAISDTQRTVPVPRPELDGLRCMNMSCSGLLHFLPSANADPVWLRTWYLLESPSVSARKSIDSFHTASRLLAATLPPCKQVLFRSTVWILTAEKEFRKLKTKQKTESVLE